MNKIILAGRIVKDADLSYIPSTQTAKTTFTLAVERNYQKDKNNKKVDFINCEMLGKHTENLCQYLSKGKALMFEGELNIERYDKDGETRSSTKIQANNFHFLGSKNKNPENNKLFEADNLFENVLNENEISEEEIPF